ncbi:MAG: type II toxin-antitoxin system YafQ family toxin [Ruminococcus sp.]|nr:type II toxin-antitoxin system YafQ family toxin [Candidatus Apopatosoma intestinale]
MNLTVQWTTQFKKDYKLAMKRGRNIDALDDTIRMIAGGEPLPPKLCDHALSGNFKGFRECHVEPDWLLVYAVQKHVLTLTLIRTGTHSDLLRK